MLCKVCNTRVPGHQSSCPNCGSHTLVETPSSESALTAKLPEIEFPPEEPEKDDAEIEWADDSDSLDLEEPLEPTRETASPASRAPEAPKESRIATPPGRGAAAPRSLAPPDAAAV